MATTSVHRLNDVMDELEEATAELWVSWRQCFCGGEGASRRRWLGVNGGGSGRRNGRCGKRTRVNESELGGQKDVASCGG